MLRLIRTIWMIWLVRYFAYVIIGSFVVMPFVFHHQAIADNASQFSRIPRARTAVVVNHSPCPHQVKAWYETAGRTDIIQLQAAENAVVNAQINGGQGLSRTGLWLENTAQTAGKDAAPVCDKALFVTWRDVTTEDQAAGFDLYLNDVVDATTATTAANAQMQALLATLPATWPAAHHHRRHHVHDH